MKKEDVQAIKVCDSVIEHPIILALAGEIPGVAAITTYWVETVRARRERALYSFLDDLAEKVNSLYINDKNSIDLNHLTSADYSSTLASITEIAARESDDIKRQYLQKFLLSYATEQRPDIDLKRIFFTFVAELTGTHLLILDAVYQRQNYLSDCDLEVLANQLDRHEALALRSAAQELGIELDLVAAIASTLDARGLIRLCHANAVGEEDSLRLILRPLARRFMQFITQGTSLAEQDMAPNGP